MQTISGKISSLAVIKCVIRDKVRFFSGKFCINASRNFFTGHSFVPYGYFINRIFVRTVPPVTILVVIVAYSKGSWRGRHTTRISKFSHLFSIHIHPEMIAVICTGKMIPSIRIQNTSGAFRLFPPSISYIAESKNYTPVRVHVYVIIIIPVSLSTFRDYASGIYSSTCLDHGLYG